MRTHLQEGQCSGIAAAALDRAFIYRRAGHSFTVIPLRAHVALTDGSQAAALSRVNGLQDLGPFVGGGGDCLLSPEQRTWGWVNGSQL